MSTRWYSGSCQCGRVGFEAALDLDARAKAKIDGASAVDPTAYVLVRPSAFHLISGEGDLSDVQFGLVFGLNRFCRFCGVRVFGKGHLAKLGGEYCVVALAAVDAEISEPSEAAVAAQ
ncbi:MAG TPA: GFA family protein [Polyangiales bacterium]|jgi:hypothetical protein|nr:GFA family protein [Polyangiales bacterium]